MIKYIDDKEFGIIKVAFRKNNRNLIIKVTPDLGINISVPYGVKTDFIYRHIEQRRDWIRDTLLKYKAKNNKKIFTPDTDFQTRYHKLYLMKACRSSAFVEVSNGKIQVIIPETHNWDDKNVRDIIKKAIIQALLIESKNYLPKKLNELALKHGFVIKGLKIRDMVSRWGSCTSKNTITLNSRMMLLPEHLIEHILLHEMCHTKHMNHSFEFHNLMQMLNPMSKNYNKEMKSYNTSMFF